jgi:transcription termination factor Rho
MDTDNKNKVYHENDLVDLTMRELYEISKEQKLKNYTSFRKEDLINEICLVSQGKKKIVRKKRGRKSKAELERMKQEQDYDETIHSDDVSQSSDEEDKAENIDKVSSSEQVNGSEKRPKLMFPPKRYTADKDKESKEEIPQKNNIDQASARKTNEVKAPYNSVKINNLQYKGDSQGSGSGVLEIHPDGYGFLRVAYVPNPDDIYMAPSQIRKFNLRNGDFVEGIVRHPSKASEKYSAMLRVSSINGINTQDMKERPVFEKMVPIFPEDRLILEIPGKNSFTLRLIELFAPIGKGQRGMIVSPPKAGKTTVIKRIAQAISVNHPEVILMIVLVDERPEEVTDMERSVKAQVIHSTFDQLPENHIRVVELAMERAKRLVEMGKDVVVLMDGITRLTRAYNLVMTPTGRTLTGGLDTSAIHGPKRVLGAARNIDGGGSLTMIATALIETGSRMDEVIYEEYKGTGNMELVLDRKLSEKGLFPAIEINKSGTRRDELLYEPEVKRRIWSLRRFLSNLDTDEALRKLYKWMKDSKSNEQFLRSIVSEDRNR